MTDDEGAYLEDLYVDWNHENYKNSFHEYSGLTNNQIHDWFQHVSDSHFAELMKRVRDELIQ